MAPEEIGERIPLTIADADEIAADKVVLNLLVCVPSAVVLKKVYVRLFASIASRSVPRSLASSTVLFKTVWRSSKLKRVRKQRAD